MGRSSELFIEMQDELMNTIHRAQEGEISNLDAIIELRENRKKLEDSLAIIKGFEDEKLEDIAAEASEYKDGYRGYKFEYRNGRTMYSFKGIPEWENVEKSKKEVEAKYKAMLNAKLKGAVHANVSEDGEELPLPEISYGKSSLVVKPLKTAKV